MVNHMRTGIALIAVAVLLLGVTGYVIAQIPNPALFLLIPGVIVFAAGVTRLVSARTTQATGRP